MIAGNIAGKTRTLPLAIYSEVAAGDMDTAGKYVLIIVAFSLLIVAGMNAHLAKPLDAEKIKQTISEELRKQNACHE